MAEATIMLMLAALYDLQGSVDILRGKAPAGPGYRARLLKGKTVGLIGFGRIARSVAERLADGWGVDLQVCAPRLHAPLPQGVRSVDLHTLLQTSDVITVLASLNEETRQLLDERRLRLIKPGAVLVNTARGGLVDEEALFRVASTGHFKAVALDVFAAEPLPSDSPLRSLPNAILTGHNVGHTVETHEALVETAVDNIQRVLRRELPSNVVNAAVIPRWLQLWGRDARGS
jgi:phosphoglycerate dehydrogenase-like enzyme